MKVEKEELVKAFYALLFLFSSISTPLLATDNFLEKGNQYLSSGDFANAEKTFKAGVKAEPKNLIYQNQLALSLIEEKKFKDADVILDKVLQSDTKNPAALWYSGVGNFKAGNDRVANGRFEQAMALMDPKSRQFYSANWFIGKTYKNLLVSEGLTYNETSRMIECFEKYLALQSNAPDGKEISEYVQKIKAKRPGSNVKKWIDK